MGHNSEGGFTYEHKVEPLRDRFGRVARKLRISVTDRCNLRCSFCMPLKPTWIPEPEILTYEEIVRIARILARMGVNKIRLTGGEPLLRRDLDILVKMLKGIPGVASIAITTNGFYLVEMAEKLKKAGLDSVTISLHSLKPDRYDEAVSKKGVFEKVMEGVRVAQKVGFNPIKINAVIIRGCNDDEILDFARFARQTNLTVRFIEYMPFDGCKLWRPENLVPGGEIVQTIGSFYPLVPLPRESSSTAEIYRFADGMDGEIGVITPMTAPFCGDCDRIRLTAEGKIIPCMFGKDEYDVKSLLRGGATDEEVEAFIRNSFFQKFAGIEMLLKGQGEIDHTRSMYKLGG